MASPATVKVVETTRITPSSDSPKSAAEFSLQLTFFDTLWFKFHPVERIFFYQLNDVDSTPEYFNSVILPKLKHSLSLTLLHYLPLAGSLQWPTNSPKPIIIYTPNDGVLVTVAESDSNFSRLVSGNGIREAIEFHSLVPQLMVSDNVSPIIALQITLFPSQGFSIGITSHHAVLDGKSSVMFIKSWAYLCKQGSFENPSLPTELTPFYDRSVIKDPIGLDLLYLNQWKDFTSSSSLMIIQNIRDFPEDLVRATFDLTRENINKLREKVMTVLDHKGKLPLHLSSFVVTMAYVSTCLINARGGESEQRDVCLGFAADGRSRLDPPVPENYFGNCVSFQITEAKAMKFVDGKNGFPFAVELVSDMVKDLEKKGILEGAEEFLIKEKGKQAIGVAGSPRFGVYGVDFGWGKPKKVEVISIDRSAGGTISLAETRDGSGGIEIGLALNKHEMQIFASSFLDGLRDH